MDDYLKSTRTAPISRYEIKAGWEIPAILEQGLNSDLPGELKALVSSNVYDTATGRFLLIPQGARLVGVYNENRLRPGWCPGNLGPRHIPGRLLARPFRK
jgi:type IV secretory pathway VirB10-like protein